jgi:glucuronate isomerase
MLVVAEIEESGEHTRMSQFLSDDVLLQSETARCLYYDHAEAQPIVDYHTHLSAADIADDRRFNNLAEIWLEGDHYKWRAMRANGVAERFCTGNATPEEKFRAWAATVPMTLRNPLYHWTHLELQRYFGITELLEAKSATAIWGRANEILKQGLSATEILTKFRVRVVCTTDDPVDDLSPHGRHAQAAGSQFRMLPTFRPDRALLINEPESFVPWLDRLRSASNIDVRDLATFLDALRQRHDHFASHGCRAADHGLSRCFAVPCREEDAGKIFAKAIGGGAVSADEHESFAAFLMLFFGRLHAQKGWVMQLHLGARRNLSSKAMASLGPDTGFDAIGDWTQGATLAAYLDRLQQEDALPRAILYNSNPADNCVFATTAAALHASDGISGALQFGPAWWFLDQKDGITEQLNVLSSAGLLSRFVGMTTDSRSFMSFPRHEYFRRILCDLISGEVERGQLPDDEALLGSLIEGVCYRNAEGYFGLG